VYSIPIHESKDIAGIVQLAVLIRGDNEDFIDSEGTSRNCPYEWKKICPGENG
jgi:hypothetical protein